MPDWILKPLHAMLYSFLWTMARVGWTIDSAGLYVIELLDRLRSQLVTIGFPAALDVVAEEVLGVSRPLAELALTLFMLLIIATPIVSFRWVNLKKVIVFAFLMPIILPVFAASMMELDAIRGDLASTFYNRVFSDTSASFTLTPGDEPQGADRAILLDGTGRIPLYAPRTDGRTGIRGVDVAASYLWATRADVVQPTGTLPTAFQQRYFRNDLGTFESAESTSSERWLLIETAGNGMIRTFYGLILILFAFLEALVDLAFTIALGFLLIALCISAIFVWFTPFEGMLISIIKKIAELLLQSWGISAVQALTLAAVVSAANSGGAVAVLGVGVLGLALELLYVIVAYKAVIAAITGMGTGNGISMHEARPALTAPTSLAKTVGETASAPIRAGLTYHMARQSGASESLAAGYALQTLRPMAALGGLATAMGYAGPDYTAGAALAHTAAKRDYSTPMARMALGQHVQSQQQMARQAAQDRQQGADRASQMQDRQQRAADRASQMQDRARREQEAQAKAAQAAREAPIRAIGRAQIADQVAHAHARTVMAGNSRAASADTITAGLGLAPGAFGAKTQAVQTVLDDLHQAPLAPDLVHQMLMETGQTGQFRPATATQIQADLVASGMTEPAATKRVQALERHMAALPSRVQVEDAVRADAAQTAVNPFAGFSAAHRHAPPSQEPIITPNRQGVLTAPAESPLHARMPLPAPTPRPRRMGRSRPRSRF